MSAVIVLLMKCKYALAKSRKWQEHVSNDCDTHEMEIAKIVLLVKWKYAHTERQKRREHISYECATHEIEIRTD